MYDVDEGENGFVDQRTHFTDFGGAEERRHDGANRLPSLVMNVDQNAVAGRRRRKHA